MRAAWTLPQARVAASGHGSPTSRGISHSSHSWYSAAFSSSLSGSSLSWNFSQITSISALLAMDLRVMWGTRSYTKPWRMSLYVGASEGALREISASLTWPPRLSASR